MKQLLLLSVFLTILVSGQFTEIKSTTGGLIPPVRLVDGKSEVWQNRLYYQGGGSSANPLPLMISDGTSAGTKVLKNISATVTSSYNESSYSGIREFKPTQNWMYFTFENKGSNVVELWRTDGTDANTIKIDEGKSFNISQMDSNYGLGRIKNPYSQEINGIFHYLKVPLGKINQELWKTDGNVGGSTAVGVMTLNKGLHHVFNGNLYITSGSNMFRYDGQNLTTFLPYNNQGGLFISQAYDIFGSTSNKMFFKAIVNQVSGLYSLDTAGNIKLEYDLSPNSQTDYVNVTGLKNSGGIYIKTSNTRNSQSRVYLLYCTDQGVTEREIPYGQTLSIYDVNDNTAYMFYQKSGDSKYYMQRMTPYLEVIAEASYPYTNMPAYVTALYRDSFWFTYGVTDANYIIDKELWRTDGIQENTYMVKNLDPAQYNSSEPRNFFQLNGKLYFFNTVNYGIRLFEFNGDFTFTNTSGDQKWENPLNWKSSIIPNSVDQAIISTGFFPIITNNAYAGNLNITSPVNISSGNLNIWGALNLDNRITLNNNSLNLKGTTSTITSANTTNYIVTNGTGTVNVENLGTSRGSINLPIGTPNNYNPVTIANAGTADTFSARVSEGISNTSNSAVNATWDISEGTAGGSSVNLTLGWNQAQENNGFNRNSAQVGHFVNGEWTPENSGSVAGTNPYTISATGISSFSPFSVMNFGALGTSDFSNSKISIYPNPFSDNLNISTGENAAIYFYDLSGKLISSEFLIKGNNSLNKSNLAKGSYIYQIKGKDGNVISSGKIIKK